MDAQITSEMIDAAQRQLPGVWNRERVRRALTAALDLIPEPDATPEIPVTARVLVHLDPEHMREQITTAISEWHAVQPKNADGMLVAEFDVALPVGQPLADVREPEVNPALGRPLELGSLAEFSRRIGVARSTVSGYVKHREHNGMPGPVDGDVYDLRALADWHRAWKAAS